MTQRTYYDDGTPEWDWWSRSEATPTRRGIPLRWGLSLDDLDHAVRIAMSRTIGSSLPGGDRYQHGWSAAATALYEADEQLGFQDLVSAAWTGIADAGETELRHHGIHDRTGEQRPGYATYWQPTGRDAPEDRIVEAIALAQVWPRLTGRQQDAFAAVAAHGTIGAAAEALDMGQSTLRAYLHRGRATVWALWWEGETPRPMEPSRAVVAYGREDPQECSRGHAYTPENTHWRWRRGRRTWRRECRACAYERCRSSRLRRTEGAA